MRYKAFKLVEIDYDYEVTLKSKPSLLERWLFGYVPGVLIVFGKRDWYYMSNGHLVTDTKLIEEANAMVRRYEIVTKKGYE